MTTLRPKDQTLNDAELERSTFRLAVNRSFTVPDAQRIARAYVTFVKQKGSMSGIAASEQTLLTQFLQVK